MTRALENVLGKVENDIKKAKICPLFFLLRRKPMRIWIIYENSLS